MNIPIRSKLAVFLFGLTLQNYSTMYPYPKKSTHKKLNKCHFATQHLFLLTFLYTCVLRCYKKYVL